MRSRFGEFRARDARRPLLIANKCANIGSPLEYSEISAEHTGDDYTGNNPIVPLKDLVSLARDGAIFVGVVLFVTGYSYRAAYARTLTIPSNAVPSDVNEIMSNAILVPPLEWLTATLPIVTLTLLFLIIVIINYASTRRKLGATARRRIFGCVAIATFLAITYGGANVGYHAGISAADAVYNGRLGEKALFTFNDMVPVGTRNFLAPYNTVQSQISYLVVAAENNDSYFVVLASPHARQRHDVYRIPKDGVDAIDTQPNDNH